MKKPKTKFQKVMKWMGIAELALLTVFLVWLFGFRFPLSFYKVEELNTGQYTIKYRGNIYYGKEEYSWGVSDMKQIGFSNGFSRAVYRSTGEDKNKFIKVESIGIMELGFGTFHKEDIELDPPSSQTISRIYHYNDGDVEDSIEKELLLALDSFNSSENYIVTLKEAYSKYDKIKHIASLFCDNKEYNLYCSLDVYLMDENYFIIDFFGPRIIIPISNEIGEKIKEYY